MPKAKNTNDGLLDTWGRRNRKHPDKRCQQCGEVFQPRKAEAKYCSRVCMWKNNGGHNKKEECWWINQKGYNIIFPNNVIGGRIINFYFHNIKNNV